MNNNTSIPAPEKKAPKIPEAEILLNRQLDMAKKQNIGFSILLVFCVIVAGFGILFWIMPDAEYSGLERRALQQFPSNTFERTQKDTERDILEMTLTEAQKTALSKAEINESDARFSRQDRRRNKRNEDADGAFPCCRRDRRLLRRPVSAPQSAPRAKGV